MRRGDRFYVVAYWLCTLPVAFENAAGSMWTFAPFIPGVKHSRASFVFAEYLRVMLTHLGYPPYFKYILGPCQLACAAAVLAPRLPRVKEWAYAGAFFNYSAAIVSHLFVGDGIDPAALVLAGLTVSSWALRPTDRRLLEAAPTSEARASSWIAAAALLGLLLILSFSWLPPIPQR